MHRMGWGSESVCVMPLESFGMSFGWMRLSGLEVGVYCRFIPWWKTWLWNWYWTLNGALR